MSDKKETKMLNENELSAVSGGTGDGADIDVYAVGQMVSFYYIDGNKECHTVYNWVGKIVEILHEPEGIFYRLEVDEQARQIIGDTHINLFYDLVNPV